MLSGALWEQVALCAAGVGERALGVRCEGSAGGYSGCLAGVDWPHLPSFLASEKVSWRCMWTQHCVDSC